MQDYLEGGLFLLLCLRCPKELMTKEAQAAVKREVEGSQALNRRLRGILRARQRVPFVHVELPVVACAQLDDVSRGLDAMLSKLSRLLDVPEHSDKVRGGQPLPSLISDQITNNMCALLVVAGGRAGDGNLGYLPEYCNGRATISHHEPCLPGCVRRVVQCCRYAGAHGSDCHLYLSHELH